MLVSEKMIETIETIGLKRSPFEACGLAFDNEEVVELPNNHPEPKHRWKFGSFGIVRKILIAHGLEQWLSGPDSYDYLIWHTHPRGQEGPSIIDLKNRITGVQYLVVALTDDGPKGVRY